MNELKNTQQTEVVSQETQHKNTKGKHMYLKIKNSLETLYKSIRNDVKDFRKRNKKEYKNLLKNVGNNFTKDVLLQMFNSNSEKNTSLLLGDILGYIFNTENGLYIHSCKMVNYEEISKDINFMFFYRTLYIYRKLQENDVDIHSIIKHVFDLRSSIVFYFFLIEKNINETKVLNLLSYFFKNSVITLSDKDMNEENKEKIRLITTGVKYTKEKTNPDINQVKKRSYKNKSKTFDLLQYLSTRITIKYVNKKPRKKTITHWRNSTFRHYKNGNVVPVRGCVVNKGVNNVTYNNRSVS